MVSSSSSAVSLIRSSSPCNPLLQLPRNLLPLLLRRATHFPAAAQPASPPPHNPLPQLSISDSIFLLACYSDMTLLLCTASYLGLKEFLPPYLDPNLTNQELITGVNFASDDSGYDTLTPTLS
ncbi:hypothetical protein HN51_002724, partial [Arachis hypogaea]